MHDLMTLLVSLPKSAARKPLEALDQTIRDLVAARFPDLSTLHHSFMATVLEDGRVVEHASDSLSNHARAALLRPHPDRFAGARTFAMACVVEDLSFFDSAVLKRLRKEFPREPRGCWPVWNRRHSGIDGAFRLAAAETTRIYKKAVATESCAANAGWRGLDLPAAALNVANAPFPPFTRRRAAKIGDYRAFDLRPRVGTQTSLGIVILRARFNA